MILVSLVLLLPMISLFNTASIFQPWFFALVAINFAPNNPCSSPLTVTKMMVAGKLFWVIILAHSITAAQPLASSLAPGASPILSLTLVRILSRWPLITNILLSAVSVPFRIPTTLPKTTGRSTLLPATGWRVVVSIKEENRPLDFLANSLNFCKTQLRAAPIPRLGSDWVLNVFLVP